MWLDHLSHDAVSDQGLGGFCLEIAPGVYFQCDDVEKFAELGLRSTEYMNAMHAFGIFDESKLTHDQRANLVAMLTEYRDVSRVAMKLREAVVEDDSGLECFAYYEDMNDLPTPLEFARLTEHLDDVVPRLVALRERIKNLPPPPARQYD